MGCCRYRWMGGLNLKKRQKHEQLFNLIVLSPATALHSASLGGSFDPRLVSFPDFVWKL